MERKNIKSISKKRKKVSSSDFCEVYRLKNGSYLKIYKNTIQSICSRVGVNLEKKITSLVIIPEVPEIIIPDAAIYERNNFIGYEMSAAQGISLTDYFCRKTDNQRLDLQSSTREYLKLEDAIKRANKKGIVFPDLLTFDNVFINNNDGNISYNFIDSDGIQFKPEEEYRCVQISKHLGQQFQYTTKKYSSSLAIFNSNLDKKSLLLTYFMSVIGFNIQEILDSIHDKKGKIECFNTIMKDLNIPSELKEILEITLFDSEQDNVYLGDIATKIAETYNLQPFPNKQELCQFVRK